MKMKKYGILLLLVVALSIAAFVIPAMAADETVYYVKADGTGDYTDLFKAIDALPAAGGKVIVASDLTISATKTVGHTWTAKTGKITVTGENNPTITFSGDGAKHIIKCMSEIEFNNLTLNHTATASTDFYCGPKVIIGENMTFLAAGNPIPAGYNLNNGAICFRGGEYNADCTDTYMEFYSGQFSYIQGGNNKYAVTNSVTIIVHPGVKVMDFIQCGGTTKNVKNVSLTIDGADVGYVYAGGHTTGKTTGSVSISVSNATIGNLYGQRDGTFQGVGSTTGTLSGSVNVTLNNASVTNVDLSKLTVSGTKNLTFQNCENATVGDSLSDFGSVTLTNSSVTLTKAYAGPTPTVDETSTLTDTNGVVAGNGSGEGGETPDPENPENPDPNVPAGENVVFLSGEVSASGDGKTPATAVKTLAEAYGKLGDQGGTIILCGNLTETYTSGGYTDYPAKAVVITSKFGDYDYTSKVFTMHNPGDSRATMQFHAATVFVNIHLNETASKQKAVEFLTGPKLVFGEGVVTTYNGGEIAASTNGRFAVRTGFYSKNYVAADYGNQPATLIMQSGTMSFIQGGNHSKAVDNSYICLEGTAKVVDQLQGGGTNANVTNSKIEIKSNAQIPALYINGYGTANMESSIVNITGGTVGSIQAARTADGKLGSVTMTIGGTANVGEINLPASYLSGGTQSLTLESGLGDLTLSSAFGDGWDTINVNTGNDITVNGKLVVGSASVTVGKDTTIYISEEANASVPSYTGEGEIVLVEAPDHTHSGTKFEASKYMQALSSAGQGNAIFTDPVSGTTYLVNCNNMGMCYLFNMDTKSQIASFELGSYNGGTKPSGTVGNGTSAGNWTNHANQMMFGPTKFDESDPFPLLYVTTGNSGKHDGTGAYIGKCAVERIRQKSNGTWYSEIVQIIEFNDFANIPEQSGNANKNMNQDGELQNMYNPTTGRFDYISGNGYDASKGYQKVAWGWPAWFVDTDPTSVTAGKVYIKSARYRTTADMETSNKNTYGIGSYFDIIPATGGTVNAYIVTEFNMPALPTSESDSNYGKTVTLYPKDITKQFETEYENGITQGGTMRQGKIYYSYGWNGAASNQHIRNCIQIFDIAQEKIVAKLPLYNSTLMKGHEPECCSFWGDKLVLGMNDGGYGVYIFDYFMTDVDAKAPTCTEAGTVAHAICSACDGVYYSQADHKTVLNDITGESAHGLTHVERKEPTMTEAGNIEYWFCETCSKYFSDAEGKTEISKAETVIPATSGKLGDSDGDGYVDAFDASQVTMYSVGMIASTDLNLSVLDLDGDGHVDAYDAALIQKYSVGAIDKFPCQE